MITFTKKEKKYLENLSKECSELSEKYSRKMRQMRIFMDVFSAFMILSNSATLVVNAWGDDINELYVKIPTITILALNATSSGFQRYFKLNEKIEYNMQKSIAYEKLHQKIDFTLATKNPEFDFKDLVDENTTLLLKTNPVYTNSDSDEDEDNNKKINDRLYELTKDFKEI